MPIYEYRCACGSEREARLSYEDADQSQVCGCGGVMQRKVSLLAGTVIKQYGRQMALDNLNSPNGGFPESELKSVAQQATFAGTEEPPRRVW